MERLPRHILVIGLLITAASEREVLAFLKTHEATHLLLTRKDPRTSLLRGALSDAFVPVYPKKNFAAAEVKLWELRYPPDILTDLKYLKTGFPNIDTAVGSVLARGEGVRGHRQVPQTLLFSPQLLSGKKKLLL